METKSYCIFKYDSDKEKCYVYEIARSNAYTTEDRESSIKFDSLEVANNVRDYLNRREGNNKYHVSCITITEEIITENESEETKED